MSAVHTRIQRTGIHKPVVCTLSFNGPVIDNYDLVGILYR